MKQKIKGIYHQSSVVLNYNTNTNKNTKKQENKKIEMKGTKVGGGDGNC